jgi:hypothetical protein
MCVSIFFVIESTGTFGRLNDNIRRFNLEDDWYGYRDRKIAVEWCEENGVGFTEG